MTQILHYRKVLKVRNADAASAGSYKCQATKNGKTDAADFTVEVEIPVPPRVEVSPVKSIVNCRRGKACKIQFEVTTTDGSVSSDILNDIVTTWNF